MISDQDVSNYRVSITRCRQCVGKSKRFRVFAASRFGLGNMNQPKVMLIGPQPPREVTRCQYGAFRLHYLDPKYDEIKDRADRLVYELFAGRLGLDIKQDVFATPAFKCPMHHDMNPPPHMAVDCMRRHLRFEFEQVAPKSVVAIGTLAHLAMDYAVLSLGMHACTGYKTKLYGGRSYARARWLDNGKNVAYVSLPLPYELQTGYVSDERWLDVSEEVLLNVDAFRGN